MRFIRIVERFHVALGIMSGLSILVITLIVAADVAMRALFNAPVPAATELSTLVMVGMIYLGLAAVQQSKANFRVEILVAILPRRVQWALEFLTTLIAAGTIALLAWYTGNEAWNATLQREMSFGAYVFPVWPARVVIAIGFVMLFVQLAIDLVLLCRGALLYANDDQVSEAGRVAQ